MNVDTFKNIIAVEVGNGRGVRARPFIVAPGGTGDRGFRSRDCTASWYHTVSTGPRYEIVLGFLMLLNDAESSSAQEF